MCKYAAAAGRAEERAWSRGRGGGDGVGGVGGGEGGGGGGGVMVAVLITPIMQREHTLRYICSNNNCILRIIQYNIM